MSMYRPIRDDPRPPRPAGGYRGPNLHWDKIIRDGIIAVICLIGLLMIYPLLHRSPPASRGVVTQFGKIVGIEPEGLTLLPPWQKMAIFSIRAEQAGHREGRRLHTSDTQPVTVSLTVRLQHRHRQGGRGIREIQSQTGT